MPKPKRPLHHDVRRQRVELPSVAHPLNPNSFDRSTHTIQLRPNNTSSQNHIHTEAKAKPQDLSPCHICHRKPSVRSDLDSFADCEGCGRRTCYICIRECLGTIGEVHAMDQRMFDDYDGLDFQFGGDPLRMRTVGGREHNGMVCSRCCVERGTDGEVWCLGCLRAEEGGYD